VFLSHSTRGAVEALAVQKWLERQGEDRASFVGVTRCVHPAPVLRYRTGTGGCPAQ
jgi:hypothetical protein